MAEAKTWLEDTVIEKADLLARASKPGAEKIHYADLLTLCSITFAEKSSEHWKYKGRICYRGDNVRDQDGANAVFQELSASPTSIHTANSVIAYGMMPGHVVTSSDAIRAYIQSRLKGKHKTYVLLWPS